MGNYDRIGGKVRDDVKHRILITRSVLKMAKVGLVFGSQKGLLGIFLPCTNCARAFRFISHFKRSLIDSATYNRMLESLIHICYSRIIIHFVI